MNWIKVFETEAMAKDKLKQTNPVRIIFDKVKICLVQTKNEFYAVSDTCPHMSESLSGGTVNAFGEIICPLHNYRYNLKFGVECEQRTADLKTYPVKIDETGFYIGLN